MPPKKKAPAKAPKPKAGRAEKPQLNQASEASKLQLNSITQNRQLPTTSLLPLSTSPKSTPPKATVELKRKRKSDATDSTGVVQEKAGKRKKTRPVQEPKESQMVVDSCTLWFNEHASADCPDSLDMSGISALASQFNFSMESMCPVIVMFALRSSEIGIVTRKEWERTMQMFGVRSINELPNTINVWLKNSVPALMDPPIRVIEPGDFMTTQFRAFYKWLFDFVKSVPEQRNMKVDSAVAMLPTIFNPAQYCRDQDELVIGQGEIIRDTIFPHVVPFCEWVKSEGCRVKVITRDVWNQLLEFNLQVNAEFDGYDEANSSWPLLFDEFIDHRKNCQGGPAPMDTSPMDTSS